MLKTIALLSSIVCFVNFHNVYKERKPFTSGFLPLLHVSSNRNIETVYMSRTMTSSIAQDVIPLSNAEFPYKFSFLHQNETESLKKKTHACQPISFGYNLAKSKLIFPDYQYPSCSQVTGIDNMNVFINRKNKKIQINCKEKYVYVFKGPLQNYTLIEKFKVHKVRLSVTKNMELSAKNTEYLFAFCTDEKLKKRRQLASKFVGADMTPEFNPSLLNPNKLTNTTKPRIIFLLTIDSFSRNHFYRKLPTVAKFLNESEKTIPDYSVFDFKLHSTYSKDSITNQAPIFGGRDYDNKMNHSRRDKLGEHAMWNQIKAKGFITLFGLDDCDINFAEVLGNNIEVDYSVRQFYCISERYMRILNSKKFTEQRCLGPQMIHAYMLNYTLEFIKMYPKSNLWIYLHINTAHERTGQHAVTLDKDLTRFLEEFLEMTKNSETFVFLGADHGMRYGEWYHSVEAYQETKLPSMFVIATKTLLDTYPNSYHSLSENSMRLTSKLDIRKTVLALAGIKENEKYSINLIEEIASYSRTCVDINTKASYCACSYIEKLGMVGKSLKFLLKSITSYIQLIMNSKGYSNPKYPEGIYCKKMILDKVYDAFHVDVNRLLEIFILELGNAHSNLRIKVTVLVGTDFKIIKEEESIYGWFEITPNSHRMMVKVLDIERLDRYGGPFEIFLESIGIQAFFCIPQELVLNQNLEAFE